VRFGAAGATFALGRCDWGSARDDPERVYPVRTMDERALGTGGPRVSRIGLGLAAVGRPAYITTGRAEDLAGDRTVETLRHRSHELLDAAAAAGVRYLDVARSYGLAESFLGSWLDQLPPEARLPVVGSKWGYTYVGGWRLDAEVNEVKDHSLAAFRRQVAETRAILGSRLSLYQVHSATLESGILDDRGVLGALASLRAEGVAVGLSVSGPRQADIVRRALEVRVDGNNPFSVVQATWNLLEPSVGSALAEAHEAGWGVIVKEALANGRLARRESCPLPVAAVAARWSAEPDAIAIAAALAMPWADVVLSGAATVDQLHANLASLRVDLAADELETLASCREPADAYWAARSRLAWQ
jgi:aryl-alcohol dehydrogenase-like predicted oxidoreductase